MTLAIVFRELKAGRLKLEDEFKVSEHAWRTGGAPSGGSAMFAPLNTMVTVNDLIQGVTVQSANDAAIILAEGIGGTEEAFAKQMTEYGRKIGLEKSTFANATGLSGGRSPDDGARPRHARPSPDLHLPGVLSLLRTEGVQVPRKVHLLEPQSPDLRRYRRRRPEDRIHQGVGLRAGGERQARRPAADPRGGRPRIRQGPRGRGAPIARLGLQELQAVPLVRPGPDGERRARLGRHQALRAAGRQWRHRHHLAGERDRQGRGRDRLSRADQGSHPQGR